MGQKLMVNTLPAEAACRESVTNMGPDESVLILIKHCRDMKQQEMRLRLVTLLLLLSCMALFILTSGPFFRQHKNSGSSEQGNAAEQSPAYSKQESVCLPDNPPTNFQRLHIDLVFKPTSNKSDGQCLEWNVRFGENYNKEKSAIVIPKRGFYFVYLWIALNCRREDGNGNKKFYVKLQNWNKRYPKFTYPMEASDGIMCSPDGSRSFFVGQLFDLEEGDHLSVLIVEGHRLIKKSSFGAYLT